MDKIEGKGFKKIHNSKFQIQDSDVSDISDSSSSSDSVARMSSESEGFGDIDWNLI